MLYREAGQFKSTYAQDQQIFPIRQDRIAIGLLLVFAFVVVPLIGDQYWLSAILTPFLIVALATSPRWWRSGPASRSSGCSRARSSG